MYSYFPFQAACPIGSYCDGTTVTVCPMGQYQDMEQQSACNQCPLGRTTPGIGSIDVSECSGVSIYVTRHTKISLKSENTEAR